MTDASRPPSLVPALVATAFGSGYAPIAPGTAGSAVGLLLWWPLSTLSPLVQAVAIVVVSLVGVAAATHVARAVALKDPAIVVVDEVVGMWLTLFALPLTPVTAAVGFLLFRALDVWKPFPARRLEFLPGGWGIVADDLMVGLYANLLIRAGLALWGRS
jgi:phosphatidylglycerophosphatase A